VTRALRKVLIANRGEIALRIIRTLRALGIRSVAAYSDADRDSLPVRLADEAVRIGPPPAGESYLRTEAIVQAALERGADAVHPGYGFLSERASFARAVEEAGLRFLGPSPENIARLGDKLASRSALERAGIPPVPGSGQALDRRGLERAAGELGFPLLLKAAAGGGGKGIRIVRSAAELAAAFDAAASEAASSFGSSDLIAERYLERARHVEVQVLGDGAGGVRLFYERDCSTQRRLQKVFEETPSPAMTPELRERLLLAAGRAMAAERYRSAGTLEFLLSAAGELHFLEMNTRLQVEHPVTEMTTGIDMVAEQVEVGEGKRYGPWNDDLARALVEPRGAALEFRVNAEDPAEDFRPSTGTLTAVRLPSGPGVRVDAAIEAGASVPPFYDSLIAKVIAWGQDRESARARLAGALAETRIEGVATTLPLGLAVLEDPAFREGRNHCQYLAERLGAKGFFPGPIAGEEVPLLAAAAAWLHSRSAGPRPGAAGAGAAAGAATKAATLSPWVLVERLRVGTVPARTREEP
jgi:acetyl/propionyl-CoA carboxylase alpha subunit